MQTDQLKRTSLHTSIIKSIWLPMIVFVVGYLYAQKTDRDFQQQREQYVHNALETRLEQITEGVKDRVTLYSHGLSSVKAAISAIGLP